jgi:hypothetical protein
MDASGILIAIDASQASEKPGLYIASPPSVHNRQARETEDNTVREREPWQVLMFLHHMDP